MPSPRSLWAVGLFLAGMWGSGPAPAQQKSSPSRIDSPSSQQSSSPSARREHAAFKLRGDMAAILSLSFHRDGQTLAAGLADRTIRVWDVVEGKELVVLQGHNDGVRSVAFAPDGTILASGSLDGTVKLWSWAAEERGKLLATLDGHKDRVLSVALAPNGKLLASGSFDGTVKIWDVAERKVKLNLELGTMPAIRPERPNRAGAVAFSPNGRMLGAAVGWEGRVWDVKTGKTIAVLNPFQNLRTTGAIAADSIGGFKAGEDSRATVAFTPQGKHFVTTWHCLGPSFTMGIDRSPPDVNPLKLWDTTTGRPRNLLQMRQVTVAAPMTPVGRWQSFMVRCSDSIWTFALSPDGKLVATCGWDIPLTGKEKTDEEVRKLMDKRPGYAVVKLWDATTGKQLSRFKGSDETVDFGRSTTINAAVFSPHSSLLATGGNDRVIRVWVVARALREKEK